MNPFCRRVLLNSWQGLSKATLLRTSRDPEPEERLKMLPVESEAKGREAA